MRGNAIPELSEDGLAFIVQTERPTSARLFDSNRKSVLPRKSKSAADALATAFGGEWTYVPGHGCRGEWAVEFATAEQLVAAAERINVPITLYVYPDYRIPQELWEAASARYQNKGGYYCEEIECCHTESDHWREDTYGGEHRTNCDCPCGACREY